MQTSESPLLTAPQDVLSSTNPGCASVCDILPANLIRALVSRVFIGGWLHKHPLCTAQTHSQTPSRKAGVLHEARGLHGHLPHSEPSVTALGIGELLPRPRCPDAGREADLANRSL